MGDSTESAARDVFAKYIKGLPKVISCKAKMVERKLTRAKAHCPVCEGKNALQIRLYPNKRDKTGFHAHWYCPDCGFRGME